MTQQIAPTSHHPLGPSSWPAIAECADFEGEKDIDDADTAALEEESGAEETTAKGLGQLLHKALAKTLLREPEPFAGLNERQEEQVRWTAETVITICAEYGYSADEIQVEQRVTYIGPDFKEVYFGTGDIFCGPLIFDLKTGDERNYVPQLIGYALPRVEMHEFSRVYAILLYSRFRRVRRYTLDRKTIETVAYGIINKRLNPNRRPTICSYCGWCSKITRCSAINGVVDALVERRSDWIVKLPHASIRQSVGDPVVAGALRLLWKEYIEPWGKGIEYLTKGMAANGIVPLGFTARPEKGRVEFTSSEKVFSAMFEHIVETSEVVSAAKFSMDALAMLYHAHYGGTQKAAKEKVEEILTAAGAAKRGEPTSKLIRNKDAADQIALALARNVTPTPNLLP